MHIRTETTATSAVVHRETGRHILNAAHGHEYLPRGHLLPEEFRDDVCCSRLLALM
jgi:hypothetical protein